MNTDKQLKQQNAASSHQKSTFFDGKGRSPEILRNFRAGIGKGKRFQSLRFVKTRDFAVHAAKID
ncbi:MAG: hypothetical protein IJB25_02815 [Clostridia bacterium]|nr:hypothetical protein [Clostridia bacterium]